MAIVQVFGCNALGGLPGGLGRFIPCRLGANHCRLRSIGWERCGHGLTCRPLEASGSGSGKFLIDGSLGMRYCSANFSRKKPTSGLPHSGGVAVLVSAVDAHQSVVGLSGSGAALSHGNSDNGGRRKIRLNKKTNVRKRFGVDPWEQPIPKRWKADTVRSVVFHGHEGGIFCSGSRLSHVSDPQGIG